MRFSDWKRINENLTEEYLSKEAQRIKDEVANKFKTLYAIPDFEVFKRPNEPEQHSNLFTDDDLNTFALNYTSKGELYSVDVWKKEDTKPFVTYYVERGSSKGLISMLPDLVKNPSKPQASRSKEKVLAENADDLKVVPEEPKPATPVHHDNDDYDYSDPETVFEDLETYVKMVIKGTQPSLLITGSPGVGKTYSVLQILKEEGLKKGEDYIHIKGRSTAAGMVITLFEENGKLLVFDDCDSVFGNPDGVNILKGALDSYGERDISWLVGKPLKTADGQKIPKHFTFTGRIIFISNLPQRKIDDAIKSRSFVLEVALTPEDMIKKMKKDLPNVHKEVPLVTREKAMNFVERVAKHAKNLELNMRTLVKAIKILQEVDNLEVAKRLIMQQCSYK